MLERPRLERRLDALLDDDARCSAVLAAAPPGFGKTTLARTWADHAAARGWGVAWLALTESDASPRLFWREMLAALGQVDTRSVPGLADLHAPDRVGDADFLVELLDRLAGAHLLVVLDDVHLLHDAAVLADLDHLVRRLPTSDRIALLSRTVPPLPVAFDLSVPGRLLQVRAADLAFTEEECAQVCRHLAAEDRAAVWQATEGWPALTRLMAAVLAADDARSTRWSDDRALFDAVLVESLRRQEPEVRAVLTAAAASHRMPLDLVVHLSGRADAGAVLDRVSRATGLVQVTDDHTGRPEYRVHVSLRAYLAAEQRRRDLGAARRAQVSAARWFLQGDDELRAVAHAVESDDAAVLEEVLAAVGPGLVAGGDAEQALGLLARGRRSEHRPWTCLVHAAALLDTGQVPEAVARLREAEHALPPQPDAELRAVHEAVGLQVARVQARSAERASPRLPRDVGVDTALLLGLARGGVLARAGRLEESAALLQQVLVLAQGRRRDAVLLETHVLLAVVASARSDFHRCREHVRLGFAVAGRRGWTDHARAAQLHLMAGWAARAELLDTAGRRHAMRAATLLSEREDPSTRLSVAALRATTAHEVGEGAADAADDLHRVWRDAAGQHLAPDTVCCVGMADAYLSHETSRPDRLHELAPLLRRRLEAPGEVHVVEALRALGRGQRRAAMTALGSVADGATPSTAPLTRLGARALLSRLTLVGGDRYVALGHLRRALDLAADLGATRPLVEQGGAECLELLGEESGGWGPRAGTVTQVIERSSRPSGPAVPLTDREVDVLRELPTLRTVEEIAVSQVVSVNTVKTHLRSVYRKLGVASRRDAIVEARRSGLL